MEYVIYGLIWLLFLSLIIALIFVVAGAKGKQSKSTSVETVDQHNWRVGKKFSFYYIEKAAGTGKGVDVVLSVGKYDIAIDKIVIKGSSSIVAYQWFTGATVDRDSGDSVYEIPLNELVESSSDVRLLIDPTVTAGAWVAVLDTINIFGMVASFNRTRMDENVITRKIAFKAYSTNMLKIVNNGSGTPDVEILIDFEVL